MIDFAAVIFAIAFLLLVGVGLVLLTGMPWRKFVQLRRAEFIRTYKFPRGLLSKLEQHHPGFTRKESALVSRGLRQFFIAYLMSGKEFVSMPSVVVDDLWHEFILYTRDYQDFCRRAFGGFLHHSPAVILSLENKSNDGLRRVWWYTCKYENIDPSNPTRLPLLFALDEKLNVPGGSLYPLDSEQFRELTAGVRKAKSDGSAPGCGGGGVAGCAGGDGGGGGGCGGS